MSELIQTFSKKTEMNATDEKPELGETSENKKASTESQVGQPMESGHEEQKDSLEEGKEISNSTESADLKGDGINMEEVQNDITATGQTQTESAIHFHIEGGQIDDTKVGVEDDSKNATSEKPDKDEIEGVSKNKTSEENQTVNNTDNDEGSHPNKESENKEDISVVSTGESAANHEEQDRKQEESDGLKDKSDDKQEDSDGLKGKSDDIKDKSDDIKDISDDLKDQSADREEKTPDKNDKTADKEGISADKQVTLANKHDISADKQDKSTDQEGKVDLKKARIIVSRSHAGPVGEVAKGAFGEGAIVTPAGGAGFKAWEVMKGEQGRHGGRVSPSIVCFSNQVFKLQTGPLGRIRAIVRP